MVDVRAVQGLYDRHRYMEAYALTREAWADRRRLEALDVQGVVLAARLASRLGANKWSRALFREAARRFPGDPWVRVFVEGRIGPRRHFVDVLTLYAREPELEGASAPLRSSWCATAAGYWTLCRDFERAHAAAAAAVAHEADAWALATQANVFLIQDRCAEALAIGERAWAQEPGSAFAAHVVADALGRLGRAEEACERQAAAAETTQTAQLAQIAAVRMVGRAEGLRVGDPSRGAALARAARLVDRYAALVPLADREELADIARARCDLADVAGDREALRTWGPRAATRYYRAVAENLARNPGGARTLLEHTPVPQNHATCAPASFVTCTSHFGLTFDHEQVAAELTHGGTATWRWRAYCAARGLVARGFIADARSAAALVRAGIPFMLMFRGEDVGHAVAVVGLDEGQGTLLLHDPSYSRMARVLLDDLGRGEAPLGPRALVVIPEARAGELDALPLSGVLEETARSEYAEPRAGGGQAERAAVVERLAAASPDHPITTQLSAWAAAARGAHAQSLALHRALMAAHPQCREVHAGLIDAIGELGNTPLLAETLRAVVEDGRITAQGPSEAEVRLHPRYLARYAELLCASTETHARAERALRRALSMAPGHGLALHVLAELRWARGRVEEAELWARMASTADAENEHVARIYADVCHHAGRGPQALEWLRARAERHDRAHLAFAPWITWAGALADHGHPEASQRVLDEVLASRPDLGELIGVVARMRLEAGRVDDARALLGRLERHGTRAELLATHVAIAAATGQREARLEWCRRWVDDQPNETTHRVWVGAIADLRGADAALAEARALADARPEHEGYEALLLERLAISGRDRERTERLRARVARSPHDAWAWFELYLAELASVRCRPKHDRAEALARLAPAWDATQRSNAGTARLYLLESVRARLDGDTAAEVEALERAVARAPEYATQLYRLLVCADEDRRFLERALAAVERAVERTAGAKVQAPAVALVMARTLGVDAAEARVAAWRARWPDDAQLMSAHGELALMDERGVSPAADLAAELPAMIARFPAEPGLRILLAHAQQRTGRVEEARAGLVELVRRVPQDVRPRALLAEVLTELGRTDEAVATLEAAIVAAPMETLGPLALASTLMGLERLADADAVLAAAQERMPSAMPLHEQRLSLCARRGRGDLAVEQARALAQRYPDDAYAQLVCARTLLRHSELSTRREIEAALARTVSLDARLDEGVDAYAAHLAALGDAEAAFALIERFLPSVGSPEVLRGRRAWIRWSLGDKAAAIEEMAALLRESPRYPWGWRHYLGWTQKENAGPPPAEMLSILDDVPVLDPELQVVRLFLMERAELPRGAVEASWDRLVAEHPSHPEAVMRRFDRLWAERATSRARKLLAAYLERCPKDEFARARQVEVHLAEGDPDAALRDAVTVWTAPGEGGWPDESCWEQLASAGLLDRAVPLLVAALPSAGPPHEALIQRLAEHVVAHPGPQLDALMAWAASSRALDWVVATILDLHLDGSDRRPVTRWFAAHRERCRESVPLWQVMGRYLSFAESPEETAEWLADWRDRGQVGYIAVLLYLDALEQMGRAQEVVAAARHALESLLPDPVRPAVLRTLLRTTLGLGDDEGFVADWRRWSSLPDVPDREVFACFVAVIEADPADELTSHRPRLIAAIAASGEPASLAWARPALHVRLQRKRRGWNRFVGWIRGS